MAASDNALCIIRRMPAGEAQGGVAVKGSPAATRKPRRKRSARRSRFALAEHGEDEPLTVTGAQPP